MQKIQVMSVFGTRPEAIKMCPLVKALEADDAIESIVCATGQHREMLQQAMAMFDVKADVNLDIMQPGQTLAGITARVLEGMAQTLMAQKPDIVLVHGDTTTSFAAGLAAFYAQTPVGHVEAGLRTDTINSPFPEELNRRLTGRIAKLHFAPTERAVQNLAREGVLEHVWMTGNTAIDALRYTVEPGYAFHEPALQGLDATKRLVLLTSHRRENWGKPLEDICAAVLTLCSTYPDIQVVYPVHPNPIVRDVVHARLGGHPQILLIDPLDVRDMHNLMARAYLVLTDSGGLQEEAPALGAPVIVLRTETERPEAVESGTAVLAGVKREDIERIASHLLSDDAAHDAMRKQVSPYGDGHASERIVAAIKGYFGR